jgi:hypothetical protein
MQSEKSEEEGIEDEKAVPSAARQQKALTLGWG